MQNHIEHNRPIFPQQKCKCWFKNDRARLSLSIKLPDMFSWGLPLLPCITQVYICVRGVCWRKDLPVHMILSWCLVFEQKFPVWLVQWGAARVTGNLREYGAALRWTTWSWEVTLIIFYNSWFLVYCVNIAPISLTAGRWKESSCVHLPANLPKT